MKKLWLLFLILGACSNLTASEEISSALTDVSNATLLALLYRHDADKTVPELITLDHVYELNRMLTENNFPGNISVAQLSSITGNPHGLNLSKLDAARVSYLSDLRSLLNPEVTPQGTDQCLAQSFYKTHVREFMQRYGHKLPWME